MTPLYHVWHPTYRARFSHWNLSLTALKHSPKSMSDADEKKEAPAETAAAEPEKAKARASSKAEEPQASSSAHAEEPSERAAAAEKAVTAKVTADAPADA